MKRIKLLIVIDTLEVGGSQRQITRLLRHIDQDRFDATLLFFRDPSRLLDEIQRAGVRSVRIPKRARIDLIFLYRLYRFLRREAFEVIHAYSFTAELWTWLLAPVLPKSVMLGSIRGFYASDSRIQWKLKRLFTLRSRWVVSNSQTSGESAYRKMALPPTNIKIIRNGISILPDVTESERASVRAALGVGREEILALFVGRLVAVKNVESLLRAAAQVQSDHFRLVIVGDGPDRERLAELAASLGERIRFLGEREDVELLMRASDYVVQSSREEGISNTLLEAMAAGKPIVASAVGGNPELVSHQDNGLLYPSDDASELARSMDRLNAEPALRARLGTQGRQIVREKFSTETMVREFQDLYASCVEHSSTR